MPFAGHHLSPEGDVLTADAWDARVADWLPTDEDRSHVLGLMHGVTEPGRMAGWIAPPATGINQKPVDYAYVEV